MRLLVFTSKYVPIIGGLEVFLGNLLPVLVARGHDVHLVTSAHGDLRGSETVDAVHVHRLPLEGALLERNLRDTLTTERAIRRLRDEVRPDLVHVHDIGASTWFEARTRAHAPAPVALTLHTAFSTYRSGSRNVVVDSLRAADRVIAVSESVRHDVALIDEAVARSTAVIHPAAPLPATGAVPAPLDPPVLALVGRLHRVKGYDVALQAFARLAHGCPESRVVVAGVGPEGPALRALAAELGIAGRVEWAGALGRAGVADLLDRATLVVMPSRHEGFPIAALEAAAHQRVVVGSDIPGLDEVVLDGRTGVLVPLDDTDTLAGTIAQLLHDPERVREMGAAAHARVASDLSFERCVAAHEALYESMLD